MIYVECSPDAMLVQSVTGLPRREIIHELKGKYEVCKRVSASRDSNGVVDEDPDSIQPIYLKTLHLLEDLPLRGLRVFHDDSRHNRIVVLHPKLEDWILTAA